MKTDLFDLHDLNELKEIRPEDKLLFVCSCCRKVASTDLNYVRKHISLCSNYTVALPEIIE